MSLPASRFAIHFHIPSLLHRYGPQAERHLIALAQDENQPLSLRESLAFLTHPEDEDHIYYMWRVYSLMQGDSLDKWEIKTFYMYIAFTYIELQRFVRHLRFHYPP